MTTIEKIRELIKADIARGLRQNAVARKIGVSKGTVSMWMTDEVKPTYECLGKVAKAYGLRITDLLDEEDSEGEKVLTISPRFRRIAEDLQRLPADKRADILDLFEFQIQKALN